MSLYPATLKAPALGLPAGASILIGWDARHAMVFTPAECGPWYVGRVPLGPSLLFTLN